MRSSAFFVAIEARTAEVNQRTEVDVMKNKDQKPTKITDFKGKPTRIEVVRQSIDEADVAATKSLIELYTDKDGFHCPRCPFTTTNLEDAVYHLAEEMNKALDHLGKK